ncbi:MAG: response regulator [Thermoleophilia bacterium]
MSDESGQRETAADSLKGRVLVVDDEAAIRRLYGRWLSTIGFEVVEAEGGGQAVDLYAGDAVGFDLVILDMIMPDVSGFHTFELLRQADPLAKVLLCSGYKVDRQAAIILGAGAVGFLHKPFTRDSLLQALRQALGPLAGGPESGGT